jgi:hypothetical protein
VPTFHAHPEPEVEIWLPCPSRHIILPYNLRENPKAFTKENLATLNQLFAGIKAISFTGHFLVFWVESLPPKPWPLTIAGIPPYFTTDSNDDGPVAHFKRTNFSPIHVSHDTDARDLPSQNLDNCFEIVRLHFDAINVPITEIQYWGNFFVIVLEHDNIDLTTVPTSIAKCRCCYLFEREMGRPNIGELSARRVREPTENGPDNNEYNTLRPGVMLGSGRTKDGPELLTSSGVLVEDGIGNKYMTVASHGFPYGEAVFHPCASLGKCIGKVIAEISHTDIAIVQLESGILFENETFEPTLSGCSRVKLIDFMPAGESRFGDFVYMNSPFSGYIEGIYGPPSMSRIPSDDLNEPEMMWIRTRWSYWGQDSTRQLEDGICGSPIWVEGGRVAGFFRYAPKEGAFRDWCLSVSAEEIRKKGYKISA